MSPLRIGVAANGGDGRAVLSRIEELERLGIPAAWLTTGGAGPDALTIFSAAAVRTERILLGTSITPTWPRHPIVAVQQAQVIAKLAPGRFRLGLGPSHKPSIERTFGFEFNAPLAHLREYVHVARTLLKEGQIDFDGEHYTAHARLDAPVRDVPVMASALRAASFRFCGEETDGAISWMCPLPYLRDVALPALRAGAQSKERAAPPLIAHVPVCVGGERSEVAKAAREQFATYPRLPFYAQMFAEAGYPEALESQTWSDRMAGEVIAHGPETRVADHLRSAFKWGAAEVLVSVLTVGADRRASWERTVRFLADLAKSD